MLMKILNCQTDGSSIGNPGDAYAIAYFSDEKFYYWEGYGTSNEAEYQGLLLALKNVPAGTDLTVQTDSSVMHGHMCLGWNINYEHLYKLNQKCKNLIKKKNITLHLELIPREKNYADMALRRVRRLKRMEKG